MTSVNSYFPWTLGSTDHLWRQFLLLFQGTCHRASQPPSPDMSAGNSFLPLFPLRVPSLLSLFSLSPTGFPQRNPIRVVHSASFFTTDFRICIVCPCVLSSCCSPHLLCPAPWVSGLHPDNSHSLLTSSCTWLFRSGPKTPSFFISR